MTGAADDAPDGKAPEAPPAPAGCDTAERESRAATDEGWRREERRRDAYRVG